MTNRTTEHVVDLSRLDSYTVHCMLDKRGQLRTSPENVADVLDALARLANEGRLQSPPKAYRYECSPCEAIADLPCDNCGSPAARHVEPDYRCPVKP